MAKSIYERVRARLASLGRARAAAEYKAGEQERRSEAARFAAQARRDRSTEALVESIWLDNPDPELQIKLAIWARERCARRRAER